MEDFDEVGLRPLSLGQILDGAIRLYRRNFWLFVAIITLAEIPYLLVQVALPLIFPQPSGGGSDVFTLRWFSINGANFFMRWLFVDGIGTLALTYAISQRYMRQPAGLVSVYKRVAGSLLWLVGVMFVLPGLFLAITIWGLVPCIGWIGSSGVFIFLIVAVMPLIPVALVVERHWSLKAILRAWDLSRRRFFWLMAFNMVLAVFSWVLVLGPELVATGLLASLVDKSLVTNTDTIYNMIWSVTGTLFNMLFLPIQIGAWTLTYYDLRVRYEAFDVALQVVDGLEEANALVQLPPPAKWFSWQDVVKLSSISLAIFGFFTFLQILQYMLIGLAMLIARFGG